MRSRSARSALSFGLLLLLVAPRVVWGQALVEGASPPARFEVQPISPYVVQTWTARDGLPDGQINAIVQTHDGYLWLGTYAGLVRFDGLTFETFTTGKSEGFLSDRVQTLYEDRQGTLWIGTEGRGVFQRRDGVFSVPAWNAQLPDLTVLHLTAARDGALWVSTDGGAARIDTADGQVTATYTANNGLPAGVGVSTMFEAGDGTMWLGVFRSGLFRVEGDRVRPAETSVGSPRYISGLSGDAAGHLWVATSDGLFDVHGGRATSVPLPGTAEPGPTTSLQVERDGGVWVGTGDGVCQVGAEHSACFGASHGVAPAFVQVLFKDREGNVWIAGYAGGLQRLTPRKAWSYVPAAVTSPTFGSIVSDGAGGAWVGSTCNGLWHLRGERFERYQPAEGVPSFCIGALHRDPDNTLWLAGSREGLIRIRDGHVRVFEGAGPRINAIVRDADGVLWVGGNEREALGRMTPDEQFVHYRPPVEGAAVQLIAVRRAGGLWLGTTAGLFIFDHEQFARVPGTEALDGATIRAVLEDADGTVWMAAYGQGLNRLKDGLVTRYTAAHGVVDQELSWVVDDGRGFLWLGGNRGISRLDRGELTLVADGGLAAVTPIAIDESDGMVRRSVAGGNQPAVSRMPDGRLWLSTTAGVVAVDSHVTTNPFAPPVSINQVVVDGTAAAAAGALQMQAGTRSLEVHYAASSFTAPQKVQYRYRLDGYDAAWIDAGTRRVAYYTGLTPGRYRFEVMARNESGVWSEASASLVVEQLPFFYQTMWFATLAAVLFLGSGAAAYRLRLRRMVRQTRELEATVAARTTEVIEQRNYVADAHRRLVEVHDELMLGHQQVQTAHQAAMSVLDQMPLGVCVIDRDGQATFLSSVAQRVLGHTADETVGQPWQTVLPLLPGDRERVETLLTAPNAHRPRVPVRLDGAGGRRYWMEIEARDDPTDPSRRILYLHDVTELFDLQQQLGGAARFQGLIGETTLMRMVYRQVRDVAAADATVVIEGETGTGKELVARAIHALSERRSRAFVAVNCAGLTESILASQLFGHRRGAFTGAVADQVGLFEAADRGTLLLDEIGDISPAVQANLLRVLQEREITRIGESRPRSIDVRVVAATHRNLQAEVAAGRFRQDLFYRISVVRIHVPALRDRKEDIPLLVAGFLDMVRANGHAGIHGVSRAAMDLLIDHAWPGNVRELKSVIESAALAAQGQVIEATDLPAEIIRGASSAPETVPPDALDMRSRDHVRLALERTRGNRAAAARLLGISRPTLYRRLRELGLDTPDVT